MYKTTTECKGEQYYASHQATDQDLQWSRMFRSDVTVILYRKTWFWRVCDRTKPTIYAGSMLLSKYLSLVLCVYTELFCKRAAFQNCCASTIPLSQVCWHPSCCTGMSLTGVRTQWEHHPRSQAWDLPHSWQPVRYSSPKSQTGAQSVLVSASWCPSSNGYLTHRHFGHW